MDFEGEVHLKSKVTLKVCILRIVEIVLIGR